MTVDVTYGSSLSALQHAYQNHTKIILGELAFPRVFEPPYIKDAWGLLYTKLMFEGCTIGGDKVNHTRLVDDTLSIVSDGTIVNTVTFDNLYVFSDVGITGLPEVDEANNTFRIVDHMRPVSLKVKEAGTVRTEDDFVSAIHLMKPYRTAPCELYVVSTLTGEQLDDFDYSDTMAKFKSEHVLEKNNFEGRMVGRKRHPITLEVIDREVTKEMDKYYDTDKVKFIYGSNSD